MGTKKLLLVQGVLAVYALQAVAVGRVVRCRILSSTIMVGVHWSYRLLRKDWMMFTRCRWYRVVNRIRGGPGQTQNV